METVEEMLQVWWRSAATMHIAHHKAAVRDARANRWLGGVAAGLNALVASSIFAALLQGDDTLLYVAAAFVSLLAAVLTGINSALRLAATSQAHVQSAMAFQGLRREIEEKLVLVRKGHDIADFSDVRVRWREALSSAPPLPASVHDEVKRNIEGKYGEPPGRI